jgi:hypothetical protein
MQAHEIGADDRGKWGHPPPLPDDRPIIGEGEALTPAGAARRARDEPERDEAEGTTTVAANEGDSGEVEVLPDGSVSVPVLEEELVVTKRVVVKERIIVRKQVESETRTVEADLARERVEITEDNDAPGEHAD